MHSSPWEGVQCLICLDLGLCFLPHMGRGWYGRGGLETAGPSGLPRAWLGARPASSASPPFIIAFYWIALFVKIPLTMKQTQFRGDWTSLHSHRIGTTVKTENVTIARTRSPSSPRPSLSLGPGCWRAWTCSLSLHVRLDFLGLHARGIIRVPSVPCAPFVLWSCSFLVFVPVSTAV